MKKVLLLLVTIATLASCQKDHYLEELNAEKEKNVQLSSQLSSTKSDLVNATNDLNNTATQLTTINTMLEGLTEDHSDLNVQFASLTADYNAAVGQVAALTLELANSSDDNDALMGDNDALIAQIIELQETIADLRDAIDALQAEIANFNQAAAEIAAAARIANLNGVFKGKWNGVSYTWYLAITNGVPGTWYTYTDSGSPVTLNSGWNDATLSYASDNLSIRFTNGLVIALSESSVPSEFFVTAAPVETTPVDTTPVDTTPTEEEEEEEEEEEDEEDAYVPGAIVSDLPSEVTAFEENGFWKVEIPAVSHSGSNVRYTLRKYSSSGSYMGDVKYDNSAWREGIASSQGGVGTNSNGAVWYYVYVYENGTSWVEGTWCAVIIPTRN